MVHSRIDLLWMINVFLLECSGNPFNGKGDFHKALHSPYTDWHNVPPKIN